MWFNLIRAKSAELMYKVFVENEDDYPIITISDSDVSYTCKVTNEHAKQFADVFQISVSDYLEKLNNLLQCCDSCVDIKDYNVYIYKDGKIKYFSQKVEVTNHHAAMSKYINYLHDNTTALKLENSKLNQEKEQLKTDLEHANSKLDAVIDKQVEHEESLYTCFVSLLNEKKRRIQYLQNFVKADNSEKEAKTSQNKRKIEMISESQSSDDYNTDDENVQPSKTTSHTDKNKQLNTLPMRFSDTDELDTYILNFDTDTDFPKLFPPREEVETKRRKIIPSPEPTTSKAHEVIPEPNLDKSPAHKNTQIFTISTQDLINDI